MVYFTAKQVDIVKYSKDEAEKKAASLPVKLTVPMIVFFLPILFIIILGPAAIQVMEIRNG